MTGLGKEWKMTPWNKAEGESMLNTMWDGLWRQMDSFFGDARYIDEENIIYEIEVPGFNKDNLEVDVADGILTVTGRRETKNESHAGTKEIYKRLTIGKTQDADAKVRDGILYITVSNPAAEKKKIELK